MSSGFERERQEENELFDAFHKALEESRLKDGYVNCDGQLVLPLGYYDHGDPDDIV